MVVAFYSHLKPKGAPEGLQCLSQWYRSDFAEGALGFLSAEQYMMHGKARLFGDEPAARAVLAAKTPLAAMERGREVRGFDESRWDSVKHDVVLRGNLLKFRQNPAMAAVLSGTGDAVIAFAAANDPVWGTGWSLAEHASLSGTDWPGQNLLGKVLMQVREDLRRSAA